MVEFMRTGALNTCGRETQTRTHPANMNVNIIINMRCKVKLIKNKIIPIKSGYNVLRSINSVSTDQRTNTFICIIEI